MAVPGRAMQRGVWRGGGALTVSKIVKSVSQLHLALSVGRCSAAGVPAHFVFSLRKGCFHDFSPQCFIVSGAELWLVLHPGGFHAHYLWLPAAGFAADHECGHFRGRACPCPDGDDSHHGRGHRRGVRAAVFHSAAPAHAVAPPCFDGHVGAVSVGHGGVVEAVNRLWWARWEGCCGCANSPAKAQRPACGAEQPYPSPCISRQPVGCLFYATMCTVS